VHTTLESEVGGLLRQQRLTLVIAESCTGGLIGHRLSNVPGSSDYFLGDVVAYSYEAKERLLGVPHDVIVREGAVSEAVALAMARGVRLMLDADMALGVTGIAGPGGGTPTKPVGLAYIALITPQGERVVRYVWQGDRLANKQQSAEAALALLRDYLADVGRKTKDE
jgi:PncC family amidohydrolase